MIGTLVGPYMLLEKLGAGGMGEVYLAEDTRLSRKVALKCIAEKQLSDPESRKRFLHEARASARLNHPNIAAIYDVFEAEGRDYIVMEYVLGETLAARLRCGRIPLEIITDIGIQLTDALESAHSRGVVHRDLKPANIALTAEGRVKVLDFGLAKTFAQNDSGTQHSAATLESILSESGKLIGTPAYMAPEQILNETIDHRTDIYSMGVVLYEMLAGRRPFEAADTLSLAMKVLHENAPAIETLTPDVPKGMSAIVMRAMARDSDKRYQSALELRADLNRAAAGSPATRISSSAAAESIGSAEQPALRRPWAWALWAAGAVLLLAAGFYIGRQLWLPKESVDVSGSVRPVIAVLPFSNVSGNPDNEYLCAGVVDDLVTRLGSVSSITVVPSTATLSFQGPALDLNKLARDLGATYLVKGGVHRNQDQLRITVSVLRKGSKVVTWSNGFDGSIPKLFTLQRELAEGLISALQVSTQPAEQQKVGRSPTTNIEAFAEYHQGRAFLERSDVPGNFDRAAQLLSSAGKKDPGFALPHASLAELYWTRFDKTKDKRWIAPAQEAALEAVRLDPEEPAVRIALAVVYSGTGRKDQAIAELKHALALRSTDDNAHRRLGEILQETGKIDEAIVEFQKAVALRPDFWSNHLSLGKAYLRAGRFPESIGAFRRIIELQPDSAYGFQALGTAYQTMGDDPQALLNYEQANKITPLAQTYSNMGTMHYSRGQFSEAANAYREAIKLRPNSVITYRNLGDALRHIGEIPKAREAYMRAGELTQEELKVDPANAGNWAQLALLEAKLGIPQKAELHIAKALALSPMDSNVLYKKAVVFALANRRSEALSALGDALNRGYSVSEARKDEDLASIRQSPRFRALTETQRP